MDDLMVTVQDILRDSEEVKVAISARIVEVEASTNSSNPFPDTSIWEDPGKARIVSVVTNLDYTSGEEQGWYVRAIFVHGFVAFEALWLV